MWSLTGSRTAFLTGEVGDSGALRVAQVAHGMMAVGLGGFGLISGMGLPYYAGLTVIVACLMAQHRLARKQDPVSLNVAFFRMNAIISVVFLAAVMVDVFWR